MKKLSLFASAFLAVLLCAVLLVVPISATTENGDTSYENDWLKSVSVTASSDLRYNVYAQLPEGATDVHMVFAFDGGTEEVAGVLQADGRTKYTFGGILPQQMGMSVTASLTLTLDDVVLTQAHTESVEQYAKKLLQNDQYESWHALLKAMLDYGAAAQAVAGQDSGFVNEGADVAVTPVDRQTLDAVYENGNEALWTSATLVLDNKITLKVGVNAPEGVKLVIYTLGNKTIVTPIDNGFVYIPVTATEMMREIVLKCYDGSAPTADPEMKISASHYLVSAEAETAEMDALMDAIATYAVMATDVALGHAWADATCETPKTCAVCGATEGEALGHHYAKGACVVCGAEDPNAVKPIETAPVVGVGYTLSADNATDTIFFNGTQTDGRFNATTDISKAAVVYLEAAEKSGEFYVFFLLDGAQYYIVMGDSSTGAAFTTDVASATVFEWNATAMTMMVALDSNSRAMGTGVSSTYENFSCYDISSSVNAGKYNYVQFAVANVEHTCFFKDATCVAPKTCVVCGATEGEALEHTFADATCEAPKTCSGCGLTEGEALGHTFADATCETPKTCEVCGATEGEALGHSFADATCEAPKTCEVCGATEGEALGHAWVDATCEAAKTCEVCGATEGEALGHSFADATCVLPMTCTVCGATEGEALGHSYVGGACDVCGAADPGAHICEFADATCTEPKTCPICGVTEGAALGHAWADATCEAPKTCATCGETEGEALGHAWADATCVAPSTCTTCGATEGEALGHAWVDATCEAPKTCATCGETEGEALGHSYANGVCGVCGADDPNAKPIETAPVPGVGYTLSASNSTTLMYFNGTQTGGKFNTTTDASKAAIVYVEAAAKEGEFYMFVLTNGAKNYIIIGDSTSGAKFTADVASATALEWNATQKTLMAALDDNSRAMGVDKASTNTVFSCYDVSSASNAGKYNYVQFTPVSTEHTCIFKDATCTAPKTCLICGETEGDVLDHSFADATCTAPKTCSGCGLTEGEALGHVWVDATCETAKTCETCGATEGAALGHAWADATCETAKTCGTCGATEGEALGHEWADATCETAKTCATCGATDGEALGHSFEDATCVLPMICSTCGVTEGEALGHNYVDGVCDACGAETHVCDFADATCTEPKTCVTCGATDGEALGHTWVDATCEEPETCAACGETVGEALGHEWADATCEDPKTCDVCGATDGEALGHAWVDATCETPKTCTVCAATEGEALGHTTDSGVCDNCGENFGAPVFGTLATFEFGANGSASHADGSTIGTSKSYTDSGYTLALTGMSNIYGSARDAKGNSCLKFGASSKAGSLTFKVDENVTEVVIYVAKYKANASKLVVNGTTHTLTKNSNDGAYDVIVIDTTVNKTVTLSTASGGYRCMLNTIVFNGYVK